MPCLWVLELVFDKFKSWRKASAGPTIECPLCQTANPEDATECTQCLYQLGKAAFEQTTSVNEQEAGTLFDELLSDFEEEEEEEVIDWSKGTFTMDDVTIDVEQYGDDDGIKLSDNPTFAMTVDHPDPVDDEEEEDYQLTSADAPEFVTKFEVPETELEPLEEIESQQIELIQPTSTDSESEEIHTEQEELANEEGSDDDGEELEIQETSEEVEEVIVETEEEVEETSELELLLAKKKVELVDIATEKGLSTTGTKSEIASRIVESQEIQEEEPETTDEVEDQEEQLTEPETDPSPPVTIPATPAGLPIPPPVSARPVDPMDAAFDEGKEETSLPTPPKIPKIPKMPHIEEQNSMDLAPENNGYWPWPQQEEWSNRDVAMKIKEAMEAAKSRNMAQSTVLLDEVGPHLGDRSKLIYPIGALMQRLGRAAAVDKMLEIAMEISPDDPHVQTAKAKLRP